MKSLLNRITLALVIAALSSVMIFAKSRTEEITLTVSIRVNGTVVKKGVYDLKYDEQAGELAIMKGGKVIVKASTTSAKRENKARRLELKSRGTGEGAELISVVFSGMDHDIVINNSQAAR